MTKPRIEEVLGKPEKEKIHRSAVTMLEKLGYLCNHPEILEAFRQAGCKVGDLNALWRFVENNIWIFAIAFIVIGNTLVTYQIQDFALRWGRRDSL